jgi:hypothetical protein
MINLIENIKSKRRELGRKLVSLFVCLAGVIFFTNFSIHEYFDSEFSIVFFKNIIWLCASMVALTGVILRKPSTTSSSSENEFNSFASTLKEILFKNTKNIIFYITLSIPTIFFIQTVLHNISYFLIHITNKNIHVSYSDYSKALKGIGELFIAIACLIKLIHDSFIKIESKVLKKITNFIYICLLAISGLLLLSI